MRLHHIAGLHPSNLTINPPTNGSSVTVLANNPNTRAPGFVQVTHSTGTERIDVWVGKPKVNVLLVPDISLPEKFVNIYLMNRNYNPASNIWENKYEIVDATFKFYFSKTGFMEFKKL